MRPVGVWLALLLCALIFLVGCGQEQGTAPEPVDPSPLPRGGPSPSRTPRPSRTPTPLPTPTPTPEPSPTPTRTPTPRPIVTMPSGWAVIGDERFGLQLAAPLGWQDLTAAMRDSGAVVPFGPHLLLVADSEESGGRLLRGEPLGQGAFAFGFISDPVPATMRPVDTLLEALQEFDPGSEFEGRPVSLIAAGMPAAYADLDHDPLSAFPAQAEAARYRLQVLMRPGDNRPIYILFGAGESGWPAAREIFDRVVEFISLPRSQATARTRILGHLRDGQMVTGALVAAFADLWTFSGNAGRYATVTLDPADEHLDLTLALIDTAGDTMESVDEGYAGDPEVLTDVQLDRAGTYVIEVGEFFNQGGGYELRLILNDDPRFSGGGQLVYGQEISSELAENGEHRWTFAGTAGQKVTIVLSTPDDRLDIILELLAPDQRRLSSMDEGFAGDAEIISPFELPLTGEYTIVVRGFAGHGGRYALSLDEAGESLGNFYDAGDLLYGDRKRGDLQEDEAHVWFVEGAAGDEITIHVLPLKANLDMSVWLLDPALEILIAVDEHLAGGAETIDYLLPSDGQHLVLVKEFFGEAGQYEISIDVGGGTVLQLAGAITYGQEVTGTLAAAVRSGWTFEGRAGERIEVVLRPARADQDLILSLVDPDGITTLTVDTSLAGFPERLTNTILPASGRWALVIREASGMGGGYALQLKRG